MIPKSRGLSRDQILDEKGLTVRRLLSATRRYWPERLSGAYGTTIKKLTVTKTKQGNTVIVAKVTSEVDPNFVYDTWFTLMSGNRFDLMSKVHAQCSCPDYTFRFEYANTQHNAARIFYGNGEPPVERNPGSRPGLCIAKGSLVTTKQGDEPIECIKVDDLVLTVCGYRKVTACGCTGKSRQTLQIRCESGGSIEVTPEHKVYALDGSFGTQLKWVEAGRLKVEDCLSYYTTDKAVHNYGKGNIDYDPIIDISIGESDVFDLTIEDVEHYLANGYIVHNCKHLVCLANELLKP